MIAGINVWTWGTQEKKAFEQALVEVSDIGYQAVENLGAAALLYEDAPAEFDTLLASHELTFGCAYQHLTTDWPSDRAITERVLRFLGRHGVTRMNLQAAGRPAGGVTTKDLEDMVWKAAEIGEMAKQYGVVVCLHPHFSTIIERENELDFVLERVNPDLLSLTIDTAHLVLGGMDPVEVFKRYATRVQYVHMKDILPVTDPSKAWWSGFRELGRGIVNFPACVDVLGKAGFTGILCVELDRPRVSMYKSAAISRQYIREELGI